MFRATVRLSGTVGLAAMRPAAGAVSAGLRLERSARDAAARRLGDAALTALDAALASPLAEEAVDRAMASGLVRHAVGQALEGPLVDVIAEDLVRYAVVERVVDRLLADGIVERTVDRALDGPELERVVGDRPREPGRRATHRAGDREPPGGPGRCPPARQRGALAARGGDRREPGGHRRDHAAGLRVRRRGRRRDAGTLT